MNKKEPELRQVTASNKRGCKKRSTKWRGSNRPRPIRGANNTKMRNDPRPHNPLQEQWLAWTVASVRYLNSGENG